VNITERNASVYVSMVIEKMIKMRKGLMREMMGILFFYFSVLNS